MAKRKRTKGKTTIY